MDEKKRRIKQTSKLSTLSPALYVAAAKRLHEDEGEIEIDNGAKISRSEDEGEEFGAYVQAWVYVPREEAAKEGGKIIGRK